MKTNKTSHAQRILLRCSINGKPYTDNPRNRPYDNKGRLIIKPKRSKESSHAKK